VRELAGEIDMPIGELHLTIQVMLAELPGS
jgi:hypothetical protein